MVAERGIEDPFKLAMSGWPSGVAVLTVADEERLLHSMTVSSLASLSLEPPMVMFALKTTGRSTEIVRRAEVFALSILAESQEHVSRQFASSDRQGTPGLYGWAEWLPEGQTPGVLGAAAVLSCRLHDVVAGGDHVIVTADVLEARSNESSLPLLYFRRRYRRLPGAAWPHSLTRVELDQVVGA